MTVKTCLLAAMFRASASCDLLRHQRGTRAPRERLRPQDTAALLATSALAPRNIVCPATVCFCRDWISNPACSRRLRMHRVRFEREGWTGVLVPTGRGGTLAVTASSAQPLDEIAGRMLQAVRWSAAPEHITRAPQVLRESS